MPSQLSFFDSALAEKWGAAFIREDKVEEGLKRLVPGAHISHGSFSCPGWAEPRDLLWNHMDQNHRPYVHRTYDAAMRVHIGARAALSLTRFGRWPLIIPVFDAQHKDNGFYQILCLFGLIIVVTVIECNVVDDRTRMDIRWTIASPRLLGFVHSFLHRRLRRLNIVQNAEDDEIRHRRVELRLAGYHFVTDDPDFVKANVVRNNVLFPPLGAKHSVSVADIADGTSERIAFGDRAFVVRRHGETLQVWPGICPHEGAPLSAADVNHATIRCPWHGLEFGARRLRQGGEAIVMCGARLSLASGVLEATPTAGDSA
jgi:nitrite reductase/ring-hydroxylating ferredoxin subunit